MRRASLRRKGFIRGVKNAILDLTSYAKAFERSLKGTKCVKHSDMALLYLERAADDYRKKKYVQADRMVRLADESLLKGNACSAYPKRKGRKDVEAHVTPQMRKLMIEASKW